MRKVLIGLATASLMAGMTCAAVAKDTTTVIHKESADGQHSKTVMHESADGVHSKTVVARNDGSRTVIKRGKHHVKKVDIDANGDKTVVKKTVY